MLMEVDREDSTKGENYTLPTDYDEEDRDEWEGETDWNDEGDEAEDVKDENTEILDYWGDEVSWLRDVPFTKLTVARPRGQPRMLMMS